MVQSLTGNSDLLQTQLMSQLAGTERAGEAEHDGDGDDGGATNPSAVAQTSMSNLPAYAGNAIDTFA